MDVVGPLIAVPAPFSWAPAMLVSVGSEIPAGKQVDREERNEGNPGSAMMQSEG